VRRFVSENFLFGQSTDLRDDDSFLENGIIDSTGVLELVSFIEQRFEIKLRDADLVPEHLDSIQRVANFVENRLKMTGNAVVSQSDSVALTALP
jgi:acyl carrier protein